MILELRARHFKDVDYNDHAHCTIAQAYKEHTGNECEELVDRIYDNVTKLYHFHKWYDDFEFRNDLKTSTLFKFNDNVVSTIKLYNFELNILNKIIIRASTSKYAEYYSPQCMN